MAALLEIVDFNAASIIIFIGLEVVKQGIGWLTNTALDTLFKDTEQSKALKNKLNSIHEKLEEIRVTLKTTTVKIERTYLDNRLFQAEMDICNKYQLLLSILSVAESSERSIELRRLTKGILDTNHGVLNNLFVIHQVLIGHTLTNPAEKGLIEKWSKGVHDEMILHPISAKTCLDHVMRYVDKAAILQFKGYILFSGANENKCFRSDQCTLIRENLLLQNKEMKRTISETLMDLANPDDSKIITFRTVSNGNLSKYLVAGSQVGDPLQLKRSVESKEGLWILEKSSKFHLDGSLYISEFRHPDKKSCVHVCVSQNNEIVTEIDQYSSFYLIPLHFDNSSNEIMICTSDNRPQRYLGKGLEFTDIQERIKLTMIKRSLKDIVLGINQNAKGPSNCLQYPGENGKRGKTSSIFSD